MLSASDLNAEFNSILNNALSLVSPFTGAVDFDGVTITLDAAAATTVVSSAAVSWNFTSGAKTGTPSTSASVERFSAQTFTDNNTAGSGTAAAHVFYSIAAPTLAATNATVTTSDAATWYIAAAPTAGTNETITRAYALWVDDGITRLDGGVMAPIAQNSQSAAYTTVLADSGRHILHPTADNVARTFTIDSNANVAYPIGTAITFVNQINTVTIAITTDTMTMMSTGSTGSRTLAANNIATALKVSSTGWVISGSGGLS